MKYAIKLAVISVAACWAWQSANAQGRAMFGAGVLSCGEWQKYRTANDKASMYQMQAWVDGFMSGQNLASSGVDVLINKPNSTALYAWIDNYCAANPLDVVAKAALKLQDELEARARK